MLQSRLLWVVLLPICLWGLSPPGASGQSSRPGPLLIPKIEGLIELDGRVDEAAWTEAKRLSPVQHRPNFGESPTERTEFLIGYTEEYLWVACRCYDQSPLSTPSFKRDYLPLDSDYFGLSLDTFNDNEVVSLILCN